jgi:hypothetical protein
MPAQEGGAGVQSPAKEVAQGAQIPLALTDEERGHIDAEREAVDRDVEVSDTGTLPSGQPFAGGTIATIDRATGKIHINGPEYAAWLRNEVPKGQERLATRSLLSEERIHLATQDQDALNYLGTLTAAEKAIGQRVYAGKGGAKLSDLDLGHEMLRMRMQQLARMPIRETIERALKEWWTVKVMLALNDAIRGIRESLGTQASKEGRSILDKIQENVDAGLAAVQGNAPAATRKGFQAEQGEKHPDEIAGGTIAALEKEAASLRATGQTGMADELQGNADSLKKSFPRWQEQSFPAARRKPREGDQPTFILPPQREGPRENVELPRTPQAELGLEPVKAAGAVERGAPELPREALDAPRRPSQEPLTPDSLDYPHGNAWTRLEPSQAQSPAQFEALLEGQDKGRTYGGNVSETRRVVALQDPKDGKVHVVSAYDSPRYGLMMVDPRITNAEKPNRQAAVVLDRFKPIATGLRTEPVQNFHQVFDSPADFEQQFGQEASQRAASAVQERPEVGFEGDRPTPVVHPESPVEGAEMVEHMAKFKTLHAATEAFRTAEDRVRLKEALHTQMDEHLRQDPAMTPEQALDRSLKMFYEQGQLLKAHQAQRQAAKRLSGRGAAGLPRVAGQKTSAPGARRKVQAAQDEFHGIIGKIRANFARFDKKQEIAANVDAAANQTVEAARAAQRAIEQPSSSKKLKDGDPKILAAARAVNAAYSVLHHPQKGAPGAAYPSPGISAIAHPNPAALRTFLLNTSQAAHKALRVIADPTEATLAALGMPDVKGKSRGQIRALGREWLKAAYKLEEEVQYAIAHFDEPSLMETTQNLRTEQKNELAFEHANGKDTKEVENYLQGLYEGELYGDNAVTFSAVNLGEAYSKPKTFANVYEAIANGPFIPKFNNVAESAGHRIRTGMNAILRDQAFKAVLTMQDPQTKAPIAIEPEKSPQGGFQVPGGNLQYKLVYPQGAGAPLAVRRGYATLMDDLFGRSGLADWVGGKGLLHGAGILKHTTLAADLYHLNKMGYYALAISGRRAAFKGAYAALEFRPANMPEAVRRGVISKEAMEWALKPETVKLGGKTQVMTRQEILQTMARRGFNIGRIQDSMYRHFVDALDIEIGGRKWGIGAYNRFLFDKWTRGLMANAGVEEFLRMQRQAPSVDGDVIMKRVIGDLNTQFGSTGKQGLVKNPTLRDISQLLFLAPQWTGTRIATEAKFMARAAKYPWVRATQGSEAANVHMGSIGHGLGMGLVAMFALTQAINLFTRHQFTFDNPEEDHKWDAWAFGHWISPLSVYMEMTHDVARYMAGGKNLAETIAQIGENKLQPLGRAAATFFGGFTPTGQKITTAGGRVAETAKALVPMPITASAGLRALANKAAPSLVSPPAPGALMRQYFSSLGVKSETERNPVQQVSKMAEDFLKEKGIKRGEGWRMMQTDEPSYSKLRGALRNGDMPGAKKQYEALLNDGRKPDQIAKYFGIWARRPFTGGNQTEQLFRMSLDEKQQELYGEVVQQRYEELRKFQDFLMSQ